MDGNVCDPGARRLILEKAARPPTVRDHITPRDLQIRAASRLMREPMRFKERAVAAATGAGVSSGKPWQLFTVRLAPPPFNAAEK